MNKKGIAVLSCILAMSMAGGAYGATSVQGGLGSNTGHSRRSGGGGGGGGSHSRGGSGGGSVHRGASSSHSGANTQTNTQSSAVNTQTNSTAARFIGAIEGGHAITPSVGSETAGLPEKVVASINSINQGGSISDATGLKEFAEYKAMDKTMAIITTDANGKIADIPTKLSIYVPNIIEGKDIKVIAYANITGTWAAIPVHSINYQTKTMDITINGSSTICVIYK